MAFDVWPTSLPQSGFNGVEGSPQNNVVEFKPDVGPPIDRRRSSRINTSYPVTIGPLTLDQFKTFKEFFHNVLYDGTLAFTWVDPATSEASTVKIVQAEPPYKSKRVQTDNWEVSFSMMTLRSNSNQPAWMSVVWSPDLAIFIAVADDTVSSSGKAVWMSSDGVIWLRRITPSTAVTWQSVAWSPSLGLFAAVATNGTGTRVMTSPDGINWTLRTSAADNAWLSIVWSPSLALFVAVANSGTGNRVMTSSNGTAWTIRTSAADNNWRDVTWSPSLGLFVAVADSGTGNRVMTSPDGINWTIRTSAADYNWRSVTWSPSLALFVAVANSGGKRIMTSPDGINWQLRG